MLLVSSTSFAYDPTEESTGNPVDEFSETPFTKYGEFNEDEEEAEATLFFQYGRFFGFSVGAGMNGVTGNRSLLWEGGFPLISIKVHYWFDFQFALDIEFMTVSHNYTGADGTTNVDVSFTRFGVDFKYYINTQNLSDAVTFASPYIIFGGGVYTKSELEAIDPDNPDTDSKFGVNVGLGLEFPISHKKTYFALEAKFAFVSFTDRAGDEASRARNIENLEGLFYQITGNFMFTW